MFPKRPFRPTAEEAYQIGDSAFFGDDHMIFQYDSDPNYFICGGWIKPIGLDVIQPLWGGGSGSSDYAYLGIDANNNVQFLSVVGGVTKANIRSSMELDKIDRWYHIYMVHDTRIATTADRIKIYVDGVLLTGFVSSIHPERYHVPLIMSSTNTIKVGSYGDGSTEADAYLADVVINAYSLLSVTEFGEFNEDLVWVPKDLSNVNFFIRSAWLRFQDSDKGIDSSGRDNHFTEVGNVLSKIDSPTNNFMVFDPRIATNIEFKTGNRKIQSLDATNWQTAIGTFGADANRHYYEVRIDTLGGNTTLSMGLWSGDAPPIANEFLGSSLFSWGMNIWANGSIHIYNNNTGIILTDTHTVAADDRFMCAVNLYTGELWYGVNGTWFDGGNPITGVNPVTDTVDVSRVWTPAIGLDKDPAKVSGMFNSIDQLYEPAGYKDWSANEGAYPLDKTFVMMIKTTAASETFTLPGQAAAPFNAVINWGDGSVLETVNAANPSHIYDVAGHYDIQISGTFGSIWFNDGGDKLKVYDVKHWGDPQMDRAVAMFAGCANLKVTAKDSMDASGCATIGEWIRSCTSITKVNVRGMDVSNVTNFTHVFRQMLLNHIDVSTWKFLTSGTNFSNMFYQSPNLNPDVSAWDVSNVTDMGHMFNQSGFNDENYDKLLVSWSAQAVQPDVEFHAGYAKYTKVAERAILTDPPNNWIITDGGPA